MSSTTHPTSDLSAYVDGALRPDERSRVQAHLDACASCRGRVAELRATAALLARLPDPVPSRRLMPRLGAVPAWLAPLRTLSAVASGACVMVLVASVLLSAAPRQAATAALQASGGAAGAPAPAAGGAAPAATAAPAPERANADSVKASATAQASSVFSVATPSPATPQDQAAAKQTETRDAQQRQPEIPFSPWLWLAGAIATAALAISLQRRLTAG